MKRTTIKDIAREAGVSVGAASFALNDRPGVSEATRERVKRVAAELGWQRSAAAAALSARQAGALGICLHRGRGQDYAETFVMRFMAGVNDVLRPLNQSLVFQLVADCDEEIATYRRWWGERRVDGVVLLRPVAGDGREELLAELGMPGVVIGGPISDHTGAVSADEVATSRLLVDHFAQRGHSRIAFVTGPLERHYIRWRSNSFLRRCEELGIEGTVVHVAIEDETTGVEESRELLRSEKAPTAFLYDNELMTLGGLAACHDEGLQVGRDVCMASFEDAPSLRMNRPSVTALKRESEALGEQAARSLLALVNGGSPQDFVGPLPVLDVRESSGPEPRH